MLTSLKEILIHKCNFQFSWHMAGSRVQHFAFAYTIMDCIIITLIVLDMQRIPVDGGE